VVIVALALPGAFLALVLAERGLPVTLLDAR